MSKTIAEQLCQGISKRSADPTAAANASDTDWQAGYFTGSVLAATSEDYELHDDKHPITVEWKLRGAPRRMDSPKGKLFKNWKEGYWAGRFTHLFPKTHAKRP